MARIADSGRSTAPKTRGVVSRSATPSPSPRPPRTAPIAADKSSLVPSPRSGVNTRRTIATFVQGVTTSASYVEPVLYGPIRRSTKWTRISRCVKSNFSTKKLSPSVIRPSRGTSVFISGSHLAHWISIGPAAIRRRTVFCRSPSSNGGAVSGRGTFASTAEGGRTVSSPFPSSISTRTADGSLTITVVCGVYSHPRAPAVPSPTRNTRSDASGAPHTRRAGNAGNAITWAH